MRDDATEDELLVLSAHALQNAHMRDTNETMELLELASKCMSGFKYERLLDPRTKVILGE